METTQLTQQQRDLAEKNLLMLGSAVKASQALLEAAQANNVSIERIAEFVVAYAKRMEQDEIKNQ